MKQVTQEDFIIPEFRGKDPNDYEFRADGKIVRKDRWEQGFRSIAYEFVGPGQDFEIEEIVNEVKRLLGNYELNVKFSIEEIL